MYQIKLKGDYKDIELNEERGSELLKQWLAYLENKVNKGVSFDGFYGQLSDIKNIREVKANRSENESSSVAQDTIREYASEHEKIRGMSVESKARKCAGFTKLMHWVTTGNQLEDEPQELKEEVYGRLLKFFKENPTRIFPDLETFADLYELNKEKVGEHRFTGLEIIGKQISSDIAQQKYID